MEMPAGGLLVAHCDWSTAPGKQWVAVGRVDADGRAVAGAPELVGEATTLVARLRERAAGQCVLVGFDFPIGLPKAYADRAGVDAFPRFLDTIAREPDPAFFHVAAAPEEISVDRPFYPRAPAGSRRQHLLDGLGVAAMDELRRVCERPSGDRRAASPLFWLVGAAQVGRAAISGWRDVLLPALRVGGDVAVWPFDGGLADLLTTQEVVLTETYPTEFSAHLDARPGPGGKRRRSGRIPACVALAATARHLGVGLTEAAGAALDDGFGERPDGEDRFDAFVGLIGMLNIVLGARDPGPPTTLDADLLAVEGWILGQSAQAAAPEPHHADRLSDAIRREPAPSAPLVRPPRRPGPRRAWRARLAGTVGPWWPSDPAAGEEQAVDAAGTLDQLITRIDDLVREVLDALDPEALRWRPDAEANTIAWLVWHQTRVQDDHVAELAGRPQVWDEDGWPTRFGLPPDSRDTGYGHRADEVAAVDPGDVEPLLDYHARVTAATRRHLADLGDGDLDAVVDRSYDPPVTAGARLVSVAMDALQHLGQAAYVRGLHTRRS